MFFNESVAHRKYLSDFFWSFQCQYYLTLYLECFVDSPHYVSCSDGISDTIFLVYYKSFSSPESLYSSLFSGRLTKHPNVCNSSLITKQPDSPVASAQPDKPIVLLCFWLERCRADCWGGAKHFSALMAANLQIAPYSPKLMEG